MENKVNINTSEVAERMSLKEAINHFVPQYKKQGEPRIAILWNKEFDATVSEWELSPAQLKYAESLRIETNNDSLKADFESQSTLIKKRYSTKRRSPIELDFEAFKTSFITTLLKANLNLIDRDTIIRLKGSSLSGKQATYQIDSKNLETQALIGHSDYIMELLFIPTPKSALGYSASVEITDITTGSVIAKLINDLPTPKYEKEWQASKTGFALKIAQIDPPSFTLVGESLARDTLVRLLERWE